MTNHIALTLNVIVENRPIANAIIAKNAENLTLGFKATPQEGQYLHWDSTKKPFSPASNSLTGRSLHTTSEQDGHVKLFFIGSNV